MKTVQKSLEVWDTSHVILDNWRLSFNWEHKPTNLILDWWWIIWLITGITDTLTPDSSVSFTSSSIMVTLALVEESCDLKQDEAQIWPWLVPGKSPIGVMCLFSVSRRFTSEYAAAWMPPQTNIKCATNSNVSLKRCTMANLCGKTCTIMAPRCWSSSFSLRLWHDYFVYVSLCIRCFYRYS